MIATLRWFLLFSLFGTLVLSGCPTRGGNNDDDDNDDSADDDDVSDDDDATGDDDDATTPPPPETECLDGIDNDNDGLTDCEDDDCDNVIECTWPIAIGHSGSFDYEASTLAEIAGYSDCITAFTAGLGVEEDVNGQCPTCDRTFLGPMTYTNDTCPIDDPRPLTTTFGIVFFTAIQWEIFTSDGAGTWTSVGNAVATAEGQPYVLSRTDEVDYDGTDAGDITTLLSFTDLTESTAE
jgi:hypothetical protein